MIKQYIYKVFSLGVYYDAEYILHTQSIYKIDRFFHIHLKGHFDWFWMLFTDMNLKVDRCYVQICYC